MNKRLLLSTLLVFFSFIAIAQDFSNKGKDFWLGYGYHVNMGAGVAANQQNLQDMVLYFTSTQNAQVTVEIPALGYTQTYSVAANSVTTTNPLPKSGTQDCRIVDTGLYNRGIHVFSNVPIVAYAHIYNASVSGASLLFPTNTLGREYYAISYTQASNASFANNFFFVVATEDNTTVEITPSVANKNGKPAGIPFNVTLNKGQVYSVFGTTSGNTGTDLTGSKIRSVSTGTGGGCKKIAVFSGAGKMSIGASTVGGSSTPSGSADNLFAQNFPSNAWGKRYLTSPTGSQPNNFYRVCVSDPTTVVKLNGVIIPASSLINGFYYQFRNSSASITTSTATPNLIEADKAIIVAQYCTTQGLEGNPSSPGDPEMIYLSPVEQTINNITLYSTPNYQITQHGINVIIKNTGIASFKLDGIAMPNNFIVHPRDANYSYATFTVGAGSHSLYSDTGFNAIAYGFGSAESYGYNAGTNVIDLYQYVSLQNQYATVNFPSTCKNTPFFFSITLPYLPTSLVWDFSTNPNLSPNSTITNTTPTPDSVFVRDGKTLYVFKLPGTYTFSAAGTYPIKVTANNPTPDGCSGTQEINYDVVVYDPPLADWNYTHTGCLADSVKFTDASNGFGRQFIKWNWTFGDGGVDSVKNPTKKYAAAGTYNVKLRVITDIGCIGDTTKPLTLAAQPTAKFKVSDTTCAGNTITYKDSSYINGGSIVKWYWDLGNGTQITNLTNADVTAVYLLAGPYTVTLQVENNTGCKSVVFSKVINIRPKPIPDFVLPTAVCLPVGAASFTNATTISDATQATITYLWSFGNGNTSTLLNPSTTYTSVGPFNVQLTATSVYGCVKDTTKVLSTIYPRPTADFAVTPEVCFRDTTLFTDASNGNGSQVVKWRWTFGDATTDTVQNPKHRYLTTNNTFTVKLFVYTDKGCISDTMTKTTIVNPLPTANFTFSTPTCETKAITFTNTSTIVAGNIVRWEWDMGNTVTHSFTNGNTFTEVYAAANNYTVKLMTESGKGCKSDTTTKPITIRSLPVANFIVPEVCLNDTYAQFFDSSYIADGTASSFTYSWNFGDVNSNVTNPNTSTLKNPTHKYTATGSYTVTLTVTSNNGCVTTIQKAFFVNGSFPVSDFLVQNGTTLCSNTKVNIQNKSTVFPGTITKVEIYWDYGNSPTVKEIDDVPFFDKVYQHQYANFQSPLTKTYTIRFVAYSGGSCANVKTQTITINASPKTQFVTMPGICLDANPRQITQASEVGNVPGAFSFSGVGVNNAGLFTPSVSGAGTFPIQYLYISSGGGCRDSSTKNITVWPSPTAKWGYSNPTCEKNNITFSDSSVANFSNITTWNWSFGDGTTAIKTNANAFTKQYSVANSYTAALIVKTDSGCTSQPSTKTIVVNYLPRVDFTIPNICLPDGNGTFNDASTIPDGTQAQFSYAWNFGDGGTDAVKNPTHQYFAVGPYNVQLKVTSINGCIDSITKPINTIYPQPHADFTINPSSGEVCVGAPFSFSDISTSSNGSINSWQWNFGNGVQSTTQNPTYTFSTANTFNVKLFVFDAKGCVSDTMTKPVTVHAYPIVDAGPDMFVLQDGTGKILANASGNSLQYAWSPTTYLDSINVLRPTIVYPQNDITYKLTVTALGGCAKSDSVFIKVLKTPQIPNAFSPNGDGINDKWNIKYLESYPGATIEVFNRYGQKVFTSVGYTSPWDGTLNGSPLPVATYYYIVNPGNGRKQLSGSVTILK
jgi:gliding motility-associated-like protein